MITVAYLGPLIGHITNNSINIWVSMCQHADQNVDDSVKWCAFALIDGTRYSTKLKQYNNWSGTIHIDNLEDDTQYDIKVGITDELDSVYELGEDDNCYDKLQIRTLPNESFTGKGTIALMSCHYPEPLKKSDKIFKIMKNVLDGMDPETTPVLCHVGDQIYADQLNRHIPLRRADTEQEFKELYENKYKGKYFSRLVKKYPSVMTLDDHEIEDNWHMDRITDKNSSSKNARDLFSMAINAYKLYQVSHGPNYNNMDNSHLWYTFNIGPYPFFALDLRTERYNSTGNLLGNPDPNRPGDSQIEQLCNWLVSQPDDVPKFILSSGIFVPFTHDEIANPSSSDTWPAYPNTRRELLKCIVDNNIQKVVFLSGDVHNAFAGTITLEHKDKRIKMYQVVSSPLHWIFPFADGDLSKYVLDTKDYKSRGCLSQFRKKSKSKGFPFIDSKKKLWKMHYQMHVDSYTQMNNFAVLDFDKDRIDICWYGETGDDKNNILSEHTIDLTVN